MEEPTETPPEPMRRLVHRGELYWIGSAETGREAPGRPHPHVVVQDDVFNHSRIRTVVVCGISSNRRRAAEPGNVLLDLGEGNLERRSVVVVAQISTVEKARLGEPIGSLSAARVEEILAGMRFQQKSFFDRF